MASVTRQEIEDAWEQVRAMTSLSEPPKPKMPSFTSKVSMKTRLNQIQNVISSLEYNYTGTLYFDVGKNRSFKSIVDTAKEIMNDGLPIQCLEALFLGAYLTASFEDLERFPLSFKSVAGGTEHRHIVLAVRHKQNVWGALGLSRVDTLMYKELKYSSLSELVQDYQREYQRVCHSLSKLYVGFPLSHDIHSTERVDWRILNIPIEGAAWTQVVQHIDGFAKESLDLSAYKRSHGSLPSAFDRKYPLSTEDMTAMSPTRKRSNRMNILDSGEYVEENDEEEANIELDEGTADANGKGIGEETTPSPIAITPSCLTFKPSPTAIDPSMTANMFVQNLTTDPMIVEFVDKSGKITVVTKGIIKPTGNDDTQANDLESQPSNVSFLISAGGMNAIAVKCTPAGVHTDMQMPIHPISGDKGKLKSTGTKSPTKGEGNVKNAVSAYDVSPPSPPRNVILLRCTRQNGEDSDQAGESSTDETYNHELLFEIA